MGLESVEQVVVVCVRPGHYRAAAGELSSGRLCGVEDLGTCMLAISQPYNCLLIAFAVCVQGITVLLLGSSVVADFGGCWPRHNHTKVWAGVGVV